MSIHKQQVGPSTKQGLIILTILLSIGLAIVTWVSSISGRGTAPAADADNADISSINSCLDTATQSFNKQWPDGELHRHSTTILQLS